MVLLEHFRVIDSCKEAGRVKDAKNTNRKVESMEAIRTSIYIINDLSEKIEGSTNTFPGLKNDVSSQIVEIQNQKQGQA